MLGPQAIGPAARYCEPGAIRTMLAKLLATPIPIAKSTKKTSTTTRRRSLAVRTARILAIAKQNVTPMQIAKVGAAPAAIRRKARRKVVVAVQLTAKLAARHVSGTVN